MALITEQPVDPAQFREVLGHYPTGVVLITAIDSSGEPIGMTVGSFTSVSLDPPLIAFLPTRSSSTYARLQTAETFTVNVLAHDQEDVCRHFARSGTDKFSSVDWNPSANGAPAISGAVATIDCVVVGKLDGGDHDIVLGSVKHLAVHRAVAPLLFFQGGYGSFTTGSRLIQSDADLAEAVTNAQIARHKIEELALAWDLECTAYAQVGDDIAAVVTAGGSSAPSSATLGSRLPLVAPLGDFFIAWSDHDRIEKWLQKGDIQDETVIEVLTRRLAAARSRGWSAALSSPLRDQELTVAFREYAHAATTPKQQRELNGLMRALANEYEPVSLDSDDLRIATLSAPVWSPTGEVALVLALSQLPSPMTKVQATQRLNALKETAKAVSELLRDSYRQPTGGWKPAVENQSLIELAAALTKAAETTTGIAPLVEQHPGLTVEDAYSIQKMNIARRIHAGENQIGWKIGLTSVAMQQQLGVSEPDFGAITDAMRIQSGGNIAVDALISPRIEAEFAFVIGEDLPPSPSRAQLVESIRGVGVALEVIDSRILDWRIGLQDTVADNASCARIVQGEFLPVTAGLIESLPTTLVTMTDNNLCVAQGPGAALLGDPITSLEWLANAIGEYGDYFRAGDVVLAGAVAAAVPLSVEHTYSVSAPGFPTVRVHAI